MNAKIFFFALTLVAASLAGCANNGSPSTSPTTTPSATPSPTITPTPTPTPTLTPTPDEEQPPAPMECEGDYVTEDAPGSRLGLPELNFTVKEPDAEDPCYAFVGPANATAGWNVMTVTNPGMEFHIMPMYYIGNHTVDDVMMAFSTGEEPDWAVPSGAVGAVTPHQKGSVALNLTAGNYVYFCPIAGHMFKGMLGSLTVTATNETRAEPTADTTITLVDYNFTLPANISANTTLIKVTNGGTEPHEAPLAALDANTTLMQFLAAVESETPTGPPPGALIGGVNAIAPGQTVYLLVTLEAGKTYGMMCFVESASHGGAPHLELGMTKEFVAA